MLTPEEQMQILKGAITQGYKGPIYQLIDEANVQKGQTAQTENQHKQGLRGTDGNTAMSFPESDSNFTTEGMEFPIDIRKYNKEGNLVRSYNKVPPGIKELDMGEEEGTVIETPSQYKKGGFYEHGGTHDKEITESNNDVIYSGGMIPEVTISEKKQSGWENFEKSKVGKFVDAKGLRKEKDFWMKTFGYGEGEEKDALMDAGAVFNPGVDLAHSATKFNEGKYLDAGLYAGFWCRTVSKRN